ncbi:MAG TPA: NAD(P)-dependent oxidoreductase [Syntrophales bacterium]|nr:NAD(P)-dependent oxidoreductase [Syntrophales bacterium]
MNILIAGGAGEVGQHLIRDFTRLGHRVRVLDRSERTKAIQPSDLVTSLHGDLADAKLVNDAVSGVDAVIHLAWSFADDARVIFGDDIQGHVNLLESSCSHNVQRFIYTSTATVYGRAVQHPVTEDHPCLITEARKPLYALGKYTAEEICQYYFKARGLAATVLRFWWAFGATIGGSNLRDLVRKAIYHQPLEMVVDAGGAFLTMADLGRAILLAISNPAAAGRVYNLGSLFLSWRQIGDIMIRLTGSKSETRMIPAREWRGAAFLNEVWDLDWTRANRELGYVPAESAEAMQASFAEALRSCIAQVQAEAK